MTPREERAAILRSLDVAFDIQARRFAQSLDGIANRAKARIGPSPRRGSRKRSSAVDHDDDDLFVRSTDALDHGIEPLDAVDHDDANE